MPNELEALASRASRMMDALTGVIMSSVENAAHRMEQAQEIACERNHVDMELARLQIRMEAFAAVLEAINSQREVLCEKLKQAKGPLKILWQAQLDALRTQEIAILGRVGIPQEQAKQALVVVEEKSKDGKAKLDARYKHDGTGYVKVEKT